MHQILSFPTKREVARKDIFLIVLALPEPIISMDFCSRLGDEAVCLGNRFKLFQLKVTSVINSLINLTQSVMRSTGYLQVKKKKKSKSAHN